MTTHVHTHVPPPVCAPPPHTGEPGQGALHAQWAVTLASPQVRGRGQAVSSRDPLTQLAGPHGVQGLQRSAQQRQPHREPRAGRGPGSVHLLGRAFPWRPGRRINRTSSVARRENNLKLLDGSPVVTAGQPCGQEPGARGPHRLQNPQPGRPRATAGVPAAGSAQRAGGQGGWPQPPRTQQRPQAGAGPALSQHMQWPPAGTGTPPGPAPSLCSGSDQRLGDEQVAQQRPLPG